MKNPTWFKIRKYRHFDYPIKEDFIPSITSKSYVASHSFSPLLHYDKKERKYQKNLATGERSTIKKERPIKYACHKDAAIYSYYAYLLNQHLENHYYKQKLMDCVAAYRSTGKSNYDYASSALEFAQKNKPVSILCYDVTKFFDTMDHSILKENLKRIIRTNTLEPDWYNVLKSLTKFCYIELEDIKSTKYFEGRFEKNSTGRIATIRELKSQKLAFKINPEIGRNRGIPQGTPLSAALSNLYMIEFDRVMNNTCIIINAKYIRYSDDIIVICNDKYRDQMDLFVKCLTKLFKLDISLDKTEILPFNGNYQDRFTQYLGFKFTNKGAIIREGTLSRQWRVFRQKIRSEKKKAHLSGHRKIYKKKLYKRFTYIKTKTDHGIITTRNFSSYARRSASALNADYKIKKQIKRFERYALKEIRNL